MTSKRDRGDWHPADVMAAVRKTGWTLASVARHYRLPHYICHQAIHEPNFWGELAIAEHLGVSPRQIWPSRFEADGARRGRRPRFTPPENSPLRRAADSQKGDAA